MSRIMCLAGDKADYEVICMGKCAGAESDDQVHPSGPGWTKNALPSISHGTSDVNSKKTNSRGPTRGWKTWLITEGAISDTSQAP